MIKKLIKMFIVLLSVILLCSCAKTEESEFEAFVNENNGVYDLVKDIKIGYDVFDVTKVYDSIETSVINFVSSSSDNVLYALYFYKMETKVRVSLMCEETEIFTVDVNKETVEKLVNLLEKNSLTTIGDYFDFLKNEYGIDVNDVFYYKFSISDFTYDKESKLYTVKKDTVIKYIVSVANKLNDIIVANTKYQTGNKDEKKEIGTEESLKELLENENIVFDVKFAHEKRKITKLIISVKQEKEFSNDLGFSLTENNTAFDMSLIADFKYEKSKGNEELNEIDLSFSLNQNVLSTKDTKYIDQKTSEDKTNDVEIKLDVVVKRDIITVNYHMETSDEINVASSALGKKANSKSIDYVLLDCLYESKYDHNSYNSKLDISGKVEKGISGTMLLIVTETNMLGGVSQSAKVEAVDSKDNYSIKFDGSIESECNIENNYYKTSIDIKAKDSNMLTIKGEVEFDSWFKELDLSSKTNIKAFKKIEFLNGRLYYSKINEDELPECMLDKKEETI